MTEKKNQFSQLTQQQLNLTNFDQKISNFKFYFSETIFRLNSPAFIFTHKQHTLTESCTQTRDGKETFNHSINLPGGETKIN